MESQGDKFLGICGGCGDSIFSACKGDTLRGRYGNKCDRHGLIFCLACCAISVLPVPCGDCARKLAKGSSDPVSRSVGRYAPKTLESDSGTKISYIHYSGCSHGSDLIEQIELWSSCAGAGITYCSDSVSLEMALTMNATQYSIIVAPALTQSIAKEITDAFKKLPSGVGQTFLISLPFEHPLNKDDIDAIHQIPANHHLTVTHPSYSRGYDYAFIASFVDIFVREGRELSASIQRSLHLGRLDKTNVVIKTGGDCVMIGSRKANNLWLGAKACCPRSCLKEKQNIVTCENCHLAMKLPTLLTPHELGDFCDRYQKPKTRPIGAWYQLPAGVDCEPPAWLNNVAVMDPPPTARQRKRKRSD